MKNVAVYLIFSILIGITYSRQILQFDYEDEDRLIFPDDEESEVGLLNRGGDPFDEASYDEDEKMCLSEQKFWIDGLCYSPGTKGPCTDMEVLYIAKPNDVNGDKLLKLVCTKKPCDKNEIWWPSIQRCEQKSVVKANYCQGDDKIITINSFGDAVCGCTSDKVEIVDMVGCHEYYQQGPCQSNEVVTYDLATGYGVCSPDLCYELNKLNMGNQSKAYAPIDGKGQCYELKSPEPCVGVDDHSRFVVDNDNHLPKCSISKPLFVAFAPLQCKVDDRKKCRKPVHLQQEDRFSFLTRLKHELY